MQHIFSAYILYSIQLFYSRRNILIFELGAPKLAPSARYLSHNPKTVTDLLLTNHNKYVLLANTKKRSRRVKYNQNIFVDIRILKRYVNTQTKQ